MTGPGRIAIGSTGHDFGAPASFQRVVPTNDDEAAREDGADQLTKQASRDATARLAIAVQNTVVIG